MLYQSPPPADNGSVSGLYSGFTEGRFRKKIIKNSPLGLLSSFFHCLTGDTFGYNVVEPFRTVLFRTGDSVALPTLGSEKTPLYRATIKKYLLQEMRLSSSVTRDSTETFHRFSLRLLSLFEFYVESRKVNKLSLIHI